MPKLLKASDPKQFFCICDGHVILASQESIIDLGKRFLNCGWTVTFEISPPPMMLAVLEKGYAVAAIAGRTATLFQLR